MIGRIRCIGAKRPVRRLRSTSIIGCVNCVVCVLTACAGELAGGSGEPTGVLGRDDESALALNVANPGDGSRLLRSRNGPWGDLRYYYTYLEVSAERVALIEMPPHRTVWRFPGMDKKQALAVVARAQLPESIETSLVETSDWEYVGGETRIFPNRQIVENLPPAGRWRLYRELGRWRKNLYHWAPVVIASGDVRDWFAGSGLSESLVSAIEKVAYPMGKQLAFSDVQWLIGMARSDAEERQILKAMTRVRTIVAQLQVGQGADISALRNYWNNWPGDSDETRMIDAAVNIGGGVDIVYLLPSLARKHLYTYPSLSSGMSGIFPDGRWTALNSSKNCR